MKKPKWLRLPKVKFKLLIGPGLLALAISLMIVWFSLIGSLKPATFGSEVSLNRLDRLSSTHSIISARFLDEDATIFFTAFTQKGGTNPDGSYRNARYGNYFARYPKSDSSTAQIIDEVKSSGADVTIDPQADKGTKRFMVQFLLPLLILAALFSFFFLLITGQSGGASEFFAFSKMLAKVTRRKKGKGAITFADVAAVDEGVAELQEAVDYLQDPTKFKLLGAKAPKGILLVGPPGTGKTLLAKATAGEANVPFFSMAGSEFVEALVGVGAARVRDLFRNARKNAPCLIFIDELDAAGRQRGAGVGQGNDEREQTLNQMLAEMDGFDVSAGVVVMGATNRPDILDPALLRPGRFDRQVVIDAPDVEGRHQILQIHTRGRPMAEDADLLTIAKQTPGFTGAELANIINEAALLAVRREHTGIDANDLDEAVERTLAGPERKGHLLTMQERLLVAYHEAGHAITARAVGQQVGIMKLSIVARGRQLGHATVYQQADKLVVLKHECESELTTIMGGLAAENMIFGEISTGNAGDLERATELARKMVATWGMTHEVGRVTIQKAGAQYLGRDAAAMMSISQTVMESVDREMRDFIEEAEHRAEKIIRANRQVMEDIVKILVEKETLNHEQVEPYLSRVKTIDQVSPQEARVLRTSTKPLASATRGTNGKNGKRK
ncbi:MAG: ATP-dependent zinc metalloprotease FtsH [Actinomycetota bacterium]|nr:ATP-dependent zinc metalloprotease FtsH [Actinomycetota bacterium]